MSYLTFNRTSITESYFGNGFELLTEEAQENKVKEKLDDAVKDAANKPKGWIANKIYSFRQLYKSYLDKANREHDSGKIGFFKNIARMILSCIDKLAKFLQNATDSRTTPDKAKDIYKAEQKEKEDKNQKPIAYWVDSKTGKRLSDEDIKERQQKVADNIHKQIVQQLESEKERIRNQSLNTKEGAQKEAQRLRREAMNIYNNHTKPQQLGDNPNVRTITWTPDEAGKKAEEQYHELYRQAKELERKFNIY